MRLYLKTKDYFLSQEEFELFYDDDYEMLLTHPQPKDLDKYYQSKNYISHSDGNSGWMEKIYQRVKKINLSRKLSLVNRCAKGKGMLLDIGAGTGDFLAVAKKANWQVSGVEPNGTARNKALEKGVGLVAETSMLSNATYDAITLWHVLEHLPDVHAQLKHITSLIKQKGVLVVAVPNFKSFDAKYYGTHWAAYDVPRHVYHFSQKSILRLAGENGLKPIAIKPMWFDAFYVSMLSEQYRKGKSNSIKAIAIGSISNFLALFTGECSSLIYVFQRKE